MKAVSQLVLTLGLLLLAESPSLARVAIIETTAPLADHSAASIHSAFAEAVQAAERGAAAMGLSAVYVNHAAVVEDTLVIELFATDVDAERALREPQAEPNAVDPGAALSSRERM
jgi:hypothetical protein